MSSTPVYIRHTLVLELVDESIHIRVTWHFFNQITPHSTLLVHLHTYTPTLLQSWHQHHSCQPLLNPMTIAVLESTQLLQVI
jgi:hypothetical protein